MKKIVHSINSKIFLLLLCGLLSSQMVIAQGYIDCATFLADDDDYNLGNNSENLIKIINGYTYIATHTTGFGSQQLPIINGEAYHNTTGNDRYDSYVAVFDANCNQLLGTYLGGNEHLDIITGLEVDTDGNIIVTGFTRSTDFPTTDGSTYTDTYATFVTKYAPNGTVLFSSILPTASFESPNVIVDGTDFYILGANESNSFPTTDGSTLGSGSNGFVAKYDGSNNLVYLTQTGAAGSSGINFNGTVLNRDLYVLGQTDDPFPTTDGTTVSTTGSYDVVLMKYDATGNVVFSTVFGGNSTDLHLSNYGIETDGNAIYIASSTQSSDFPTTDGSTPAGLRDLYLRKYDLGGSLLFSKLFGTSSHDNLYSMQVVNNAVYLIAEAKAGLPVVNGILNAGGDDVYFLKLDTNGNIAYSTYYGGASSDQPSDFYINADGEIFFLSWGTNALTTDGTSGNGTSIVKLNADGSLCAASHLNDNPLYFPTKNFNVIGDTVYIVNIVAEFFGADNYSTDGSTMFPNDGYDVQLTKFVFCPAPTPVASDDLTPSIQTVCQNGLVAQIIGEEQVIDGSTFPQLFDQGTPLDQKDIELKYQWQVATSPSGPWTDIPGPVAQQQNYTPPPTTSNQYYQRLTKTSECCGGMTISTSSLSSVLISGDTAPTVDAGGTFYTCPSSPVTLDATVTGGTPDYIYSWDDGAFTVEDPSITTTESTVYTLLVTDANGCMQADQATIVVYTADAGEAKSVCEGVGSTIGGSPLAGIPVVASGDTPPAGVYSIEYAWAPMTGLSCSDCPNPTAIPASDTDYTLTVTINKPDGSTCQTTDMVTVNVFSAPANADFAGADRAICLGETIQLGTAPEPGIEVSLTGATITQASVDGGTATIANLTDNDFSTGGHTADGGEIVIDLGNEQLMNTIQVAALSGFTDDDGGFLEVSVDGTNYTRVNFNSSGYSDTGLTTYSFTTQNVRYIRFRPWFSARDVSISEVKTFLEYVYIWSPGLYITTDNSYATFDAGNLEMPTTNPITYTVTANIGECNFYDQVTVAVIEARADEDYCGPRTVGEPDRSPNVPETFSWVKITDASITTGTGDFTGVTDEAIVPVSASVGGDVGYELTTSYTLNGSTAICRDTVIVPSTCGPGSCDVIPMDGGCPDFDNGNPALMAIYPNSETENWTISWTTSLGMVGLDNYGDVAVVNLTDNVDKRVFVTFTSTIDPSYSCTDSIDINSAVYSEPTFTSTTPVTTCNNVAVNIGNPANNSGLTYEWSNAQFLDDATISYPEATVNNTTEFVVTVTDNITGCQVKDTIVVEVPTAASAGPDLVVCDNGIVTIGESPAQAGYTYSWSPAGADWRNGTDENDAQPDVFVATTQTFTLAVTDPSGTCMTTDDVEVIVEPLPPAFTLPDLTYCPSQTDALVLGTDDGTTTGVNQVPAGYTYAWSPAGVSDATAINPTVNTPLPTSSATFEVIVRNINGCNVKVTQTINPTVTAPLVGGNKTICFGESTFIGDDANPTGGGETYSWAPSTDLSDATAANPEFTPSAAGTFTFTVTKTVGGCANTAEVTINVNEATAPSLTPQTICAGGSVEIGVVNDPALQYEWFPATDLDNPFIANPIFSGTSSTNYTLTIVDGNGCTAETSTSVSVNPAPALTISLPDSTICDANATSIVINAGVDPVGAYAYQWSPTVNLDNPNVLNPTFFIPGEGDYEYVLEVIDQSTGCSVFDTTMMSVRLNSIPEVTAFAIQPSCDNDVVQSDGYLQLSVVTNGDRVNFSTGNTYAGDTDYANATSIGALPFQFATGQSNPSSSQDYTVRVFNGASDCFIDVVVTMNEQDCTIGCNCKEYIYLNEPDHGGRIHKYEVNLDGTLTEIFNGGPSWYPGTSTSELPSPHGLVPDLNGFLYSAETITSGEVRKLTCDGEIFAEEDFLINLSGRAFNFVSIGNTLYVQDGTSYDFCTAQPLDNVQFCESPSISGHWGLHYDKNTNYFYGSYSDGNPGHVWRFSTADYGTGNCVDPFIRDTTFENNIPNIDFSTDGDRVRGIVTDPTGNIYVNIWNQSGGAAVSGYIAKFDAGGNFISYIEDTAEDGTGFFNPAGSVYSETSGFIYTSTQSRVDDCLAYFDTNLVYQGAAVDPSGDTGQGQTEFGYSKAISIVKECCPINNNVTVDTTLCEVAINDVVFLQELISCDGIICEGMWAEAMSNTGLTYNDCDNSITITSMDACGSFTMESDGTGNNPQCGAFKITVNIEVENITAPVIAGNQTVCADNNNPEPFTITTPATGSQTISYRWQSSTTDCTTGFTDIIGAPTDGTAYDPPALEQDTYYRMIAEVDGNCASGMCADTSNCVAITVVPIPSLTLTDPADVCVDGSDMTFMATPVNGSFSSNALGGFTFDNAAGTATIDVDIAGAGTYTVNYAFTDGNGCMKDSTVSVTINPLPLVTLTDPADVCVDGSDMTFMATPVNGSFSSNALGGFTFDNAAGTATIDVDIAGAGTYTVNYAFTDGNGCMKDSTVSVTINPLPLVTLTDPADVCVDGSDMTFMATPVNGSFSSNALGGFTFDNAAGTATIDVDVAGAGTYTVNYAFTDGNGCMKDSTVSVTINPLPLVTLTDPADVCVDGSDMTFMATPVNGSFSSNALGGFTFDNAAGTATIDVDVAGAGTYTVNYAFTDGNGCMKDSTVSVTINPVDTTEISESICSNQTFTFNGVELSTSGLYLDTLGQTNGCDSIIRLSLSVLSTPLITTKDTSVCEGQPIDLSMLVEGSVQNTLEYGMDSNYGGSNMVNPLTSTTYFIRDSNTTNMCVDTALIFVQVDSCDWGDLPDTSAMTNAGDYQTLDANSGPVHIINPAITLGATIDGETDGQSSTDALGDGVDEDGTIIFESLDISPGGTFRLPLSYTNTTGSPAQIEAWIDWNNNGEFDNGEMVFDETDPGTGLYDRLEITVPTDAVTGEFLGLRIRISNQDNMTPYGLIDGGEVEDYLIGLDCPTQICVPIEVTIRK